MDTPWDAYLQRLLADLETLEATGLSLDDLWDPREECRRKKSRSRWECATIVYRMASPPLWWVDRDKITDGYAYFLTKCECEAHVLNLELQVGPEFGFPRPVVAVE